MSRALVLFCLGVLLAGCLNVKTCSRDSDCGPAARCDAALLFCVFDPDAGTGATGGGAGGGGGGTTGGGGGGAMTGGGDGGGMLDGGQDAGPAPFCSVTCVDPFECQASLSGGTCVPAYVIAFMQPAAGSTFAGSATTTGEFVVSLRRVDGGLSLLPSVPFSIPALTSPVPPAALVPLGPGTFHSAVNLPVDTRAFQAIAGWDGGPLARVDFFVDRRPPVLTLELPASDGGRPLRDAIIPIAIHSTRLLNPAALTLMLVGTDGGLVAQQAPFDAGFCTSQGLILGANDHCTSPAR